MIPLCHLDSKVKSNFEVVDICYYLMCPICSVVQEAHPFSGSGKKILGCLERKNTHTHTSYSAWNVAPELAIYQIKWEVGWKIQNCKISPLQFEISTRPLMLTWSLQLFAPQHGWRVSPDSWSQWQYFRNPMFGVENLQDKRQPSKHHTESYPRIARSRKKQRKPERDWRIECAQLLLTIFACAKHLAYGSNARECSFQHYDHDELSYHGQIHAPFWEQIWPLEPSIMAAKRGKTTLCRIPIMKMRSGPPRPHSTLKTWQTKRQIWAFDFQPGVIWVDDSNEKCSSNLFVMQAPTLQAMLDEGFNAALDTAVGALDWFERIEKMNTNGVALQGIIISWKCKCPLLWIAPNSLLFVWEEPRWSAFAIRYQLVLKVVPCIYAAFRFCSCT